MSQCTYANPEFFFTLLNFSSTNDTLSFTADTDMVPCLHVRHCRVSILTRSKLNSNVHCIPAHRSVGLPVSP